MGFCRRIAARNNLYLFAWLTAIAMPWALQWFVGTNDDILSYLGDYYGPLTLFMFFTLTYGFATVFTAYYVMGGLRGSGTLDSLRLSQLTPGEVVGGVFLQLERILIPPMLGFLASFALSVVLQPANREIFSSGWLALVGAAFGLVLNQALLVALMLLALFRREHLWALFVGTFSMPLAVVPVVAIYIMHIPVAVYMVGMLCMVLAILAIARSSLARLWRAQGRPQA